VRKYLRYCFLVLAARPSDEPGSCLPRLKQELRAAGYTVKVVPVDFDPSEQYYDDKAQAIFDYLSK
jgi:hypothetical protein